MMMVIKVGQGVARRDSHTQEIIFEWMVVVITFTGTGNRRSDNNIYAFVAHSSSFFFCFFACMQQQPAAVQSIYVECYTIATCAWRGSNFLAAMAEAASEQMRT